MLDPDHRLDGYGEIAWNPVGASYYGTFPIADPRTQAGVPSVEYIINLRPSRPDEPTLLLRINGSCAARIDINGRHKFDGEMVARQATHLQAYERGSSQPMVTRDLSAERFPSLTKGVNVTNEEELRRCFRESVAFLNVDVSGVQWTPAPIGGGSQ